MGEIEPGCLAICEEETVDENEDCREEEPGYILLDPEALAMPKPWP